VTTPVRYRVWCLSWDDEEEYGSDVVGYDFMNHDHSKQERGVVYVPSVSLGTPAEAAEAYADYAHAQRDGNESSWPLTFRVRGPDGSLQDFEVDREYVPEFSASPVKLPAGKERIA
jgi:hypothetical protein